VLTFCLRRQCNLRPAEGAAWDGHTRALEHFCQNLIEDKFLTCVNAAAWAAKPHVGAELRYVYGKDRTTNADPRSQARFEQST
jgi:hypothetical protein